MSDYQLFNGDCLKYMRTLEAGSVDAIITDLPYGTTACSWDEIIPFEPMWAGIKRVLKPRGVFVTTASQPFTSKLIMSNLEWFKHEWIFEKTKATGHANVNYQPMKAHENILVFCDGSPTYNPQKEDGLPYKQPRTNSKYDEKINPAFRVGTKVFDNTEGGRFPRSIVSFQNAYYTDGGQLHPTQKPVALYEYLIRTYSNPDDMILDFCFGSGTTGVAAIRTGRKFKGSETDENYFSIAQKRIATAALQPPLFIHESKSQAKQGVLIE